MLKWFKKRKFDIENVEEFDKVDFFNYYFENGYSKKLVKDYLEYKKIYKDILSWGDGVYYLSEKHVIKYNFKTITTIVVDNGEIRLREINPFYFISIPTDEIPLPYDLKLIKKIFKQIKK